MPDQISDTLGLIVSKLDGLETRVAKVDVLDDKVGRLVKLLDGLTPQLADISGFIKYGVPELATKEELAKRPTRRQAIFDIGWMAALVGTLLTIGSRLAH